MILVHWMGHFATVDGTLFVLLLFKTIESATCIIYGSVLTVTVMGLLIDPEFADTLDGLLLVFPAGTIL